MLELRNHCLPEAATLNARCAVDLVPKYSKDHDKRVNAGVLLVEETDHVISDPYYFTGFVEHLGLFTFQLLT